MRFLVYVDGRCLEQLGTFDGDILEIDTEIEPCAGDIVWCRIDGAEMVKEYLGCLNNVYAVRTRYAGEILQLGFFLTRSELLGVAAACFSPTGDLRWERGEPQTGDNLRAGNSMPIGVDALI